MQIAAPAGINGNAPIEPSMMQILRRSEREGCGRFRHVDAANAGSPLASGQDMRGTGGGEPEA
jgi:hypothetical protein